MISPRIALMKSLKDLKPLILFLREIQQINSAVSLLSWDQETYMPKGGGEARAEQLAALEGMAHQKKIGPHMKRLLSRWIDIKTGVPEDEVWDDPSRALLREVFRDYNKAVRLPTEFVKREAKITSIAQQVWAEAKEKSDFPSFAPYLKSIVALKKEEASLLADQSSPYDALIDYYEPGMTVTRLVPLFAALKKELLALLEKVQRAPIAPRDDFLHRCWPARRQLAFGRRVLETMGYSFLCGRQDLSAHPFTTSFHPTDVRITTRMNEYNFLSSFFSSLHEGGHALYDQGLNAEYFGTPLGETLSLGIHESQSRLWENGIGRSMPFWNYFYPILKEAFPRTLQDIGLEAFYGAINRVSPSLIRVEADELTYNLHVMVRFEIERALMEEDLPVEEIPRLWNEKMEAYLGVVPDSDADGALQDIHWAGGAFGYFPTYTLGNLYAAQFLSQARKDIPSLETDIGQGRLTILTHWLNEKIHRFGRRYSSDDLVRRVTGEPLNPSYFVDGLREKLGEIYGF